MWSPLFILYKITLQQIADFVFRHKVDFLSHELYLSIALLLGYNLSLYAIEVLALESGTRIESFSRAKRNLSQMSVALAPI